MTGSAQRLHGPDSGARGHTVCATRRGAAKSAVLGARIVGSAAAPARSARLARRLVRLLGSAQVTLTNFVEFALVEIFEIEQGLVGAVQCADDLVELDVQDRKSTRLNSSH